MSKKLFVDAVKTEETVKYSVHPIEEFEPVAGERLASWGFVEREVSKLLGKTLTLIDATIVPKNQNKAAKDLLRNLITEEFEFLGEWMFDQKVMQQYATENYEKAVKDGREIKPIDSLEIIK